MLAVSGGAETIAMGAESGAGTIMVSIVGMSEMYSMKRRVLIFDIGEE